MATEFKLPELGENIDSGDLVRLMISPGASVAEGSGVVGAGPVCPASAAMAPTARTSPMNAERASKQRASAVMRLSYFVGWF